MLNTRAVCLGCLDVWLATVLGGKIVHIALKDDPEHVLCCLLYLNFVEGQLEAVQFVGNFRCIDGNTQESPTAF